MRVTVCQLRDEPRAFDNDWANLCAHTRRERSELVLLPEMPFARWFAEGRSFTQSVWGEAVSAHAHWEPRIAELGAPFVIATRPADRGARRHNEAFLVARDGSTGVHDKRYLPDEGGYWEASWYQAGDGVFDPVAVGDATVGVQICTEMWMLDVSRQYGLRGVSIIAVPRATPVSTRERWLVGGRVAAIVSGAYCLSSNRSGTSLAGDQFGGLGWIIDPDGEVIAITSDVDPFITRELDLERAAAAKLTYPRYVR
jgi:N-carbamoylputrescine amidase